MVERYSRLLWSLDTVDRVIRGLQLLSPGPEGLGYGQEFLAVGVVVEFCTRQGACVEYHRAN